MNKKIKKVLITTGIVSLMMFGGLVGKTDNAPFSPMTTYAAEVTYSDNWKMDNAGNWRYYLNDGSVVTNSWVQDHGEWYLLGSDGNMRTGLFKSNGNKYYLLDTVRGTGTYGKLLKNGSVYSGITLQCDTSSTYEGALSQETINALRGIGLDFESAPSVENTQHVENGVAAPQPTPQQPSHQTPPKANLGGLPDPSTLTEEQIRDGSGYTGPVQGERWY